MPRSGPSRRRIEDPKTLDVIGGALRGAEPCIRGTRIWVSFVLDLLADGISEAELRDEYPQLIQEDVLAAVAYRAEASRERVIPVSVEPAA